MIRRDTRYQHVGTSTHAFGLVSPHVAHQFQHVQCTGPTHVSHMFPVILTSCPFLFPLEDIFSRVRILTTPLRSKQAYALQTRSIMNQAVKDAILDGPALAPPPGVKPNFVNPDNLAHPGLAVLQLTIATLVVLMRTYTKLGVLRKMQAEDCEYLLHDPQT